LQRTTQRKSPVGSALRIVRAVERVAPCSYNARMRAVGVRELKNRLSEYLRLVRNGEEILVTDHGEVVAELRQPTPRFAAAHPGLLDSFRRGRARPGLPNSAELYPPTGSPSPEGTASSLLDEERGGR
jgi:antitoxin (DNA-binding transcriptional repressor) of toxin-antitoxin stability system